MHLPLVELVDVGDGRLEERALLLADGLGVAEAVLGARDLRLDRARREALRVDLELVHAALDHPPRIGLVVDREAALVGEPVGVLAEDPHAGRVEGHHPHDAGRGTGQGADPLLHLAGRLVREGDREDLARARHPGREQVGDPMGQNAGLSGTGTGEDEQRALAVLDRLGLRGIEAGEQPLDRRRAGADRRSGGLPGALVAVEIGPLHRRPRIDREEAQPTASGWISPAENDAIRDGFCHRPAWLTPRRSSGRASGRPRGSPPRPHRRRGWRAGARSRSSARRGP